MEPQIGKDLTQSQNLVNINASRSPYTRRMNINTNINSAIRGSTIKLAQGEAGSPKISGDGQVVVWNQATEDGLEIMRYKDGKIEQITHNNLGDMHATPNHDGSVIVWDRFNRENANDPEGRWQVVLWKDGKETVITENTGNCMNATVSANGQVVAWVNDITGQYAQSIAQYYTVSDGQTRDLSYDQEYAYPPSVSADGSRIFFSLNNSDGAEIWMKDQNGDVKLVTDSPSIPESSVTTTADGKTVFFSQPSPNGDDDLFRLDLEPFKLSTVSADANADEVWCSTSADGSKVAWTNFDRSGQEVDAQIMVRDGDKVAAISEGPRMHSFPSMSADGNAVVYMDVNPANTDDVAICLWKREAAAR